MVRKRRSRQVNNADERCLASYAINVVDDRTPDRSIGGIVWDSHLATDAEDGSDGGVARCRWRVVPPDEDDRRGAVAWDVGAGDVDHVGEVHLHCQIVLDELLAEVPLHEGVGRDLADPAARARPPTVLRELKEALAEGHGQ